MRAIQAFLARHPAPAYFALVFAISWGGVLLVIGPTGSVASQAEFERLFPLALIVMVLGPSLAGLGLTAVVHGRAGLRALRSRLLHARVGARWYVIALATAPLYFAAILLALSRVDARLLPGILVTGDRAGLLVRGVAAAVAAGVFEELGWTGFAVPTLRRRHGVVTTGLIVGVLWAAWHFLVKIWAGRAFGLADDLPADLLAAVLQLTGFRILMVWVYDRTDSLLIAVLMHASLTASTVVLAPLAAGSLLAGVNLVLAAVPWAILAIAALSQRATRGRASRPARSRSHARARRARCRRSAR